ncbi:uncharacterized protein LOC143021651 [Oratosquilla oratoria]|uniref:uncharacterized protein LOC143021651 n=1 Tax=Oratosquilla oratoria TaxID=337810 RepID=UPI003F76FE8D
MGPMCFLILINDALMETPHIWKYVDDCTVDIPINSRQPDYSSLQNTLDQGAALNNLKTWTENSNVTVNHRKTVVMHVCTSKQAVPPPQLSLGTHSLQVVQSTKPLGIILDNHLNWNQHIDKIIRTASYKLYMLHRLRSLCIPSPDLEGVYTTLVLPTLVYASPACSSSLNIIQSSKLERVQKRECRIILGGQYEGYEHALTTLSLPRVSDKHIEALRKFGQDLMFHSRHRHFLTPDATPARHAIRHTNKVQPIRAPRTDRYKNSAIPSIIRTINSF